MSEVMNLDSILEELGYFGKYQIQIYIYIMLTVGFRSMYSNQYVLVAGPVEYRCKVPECESDPVKFKTGPWGVFALPPNRDCYRYVPIGTNCHPSSFSNKTQICQSWVYENNYSIVTEFNLACQEWKRTMVGTVRNFAYFLALPLVAFLSDRYGRKPTLIFAAVAPAVIGIVRGFCNDYYLYLMVDFVESFVGCAIVSTAYILGLEMVNLKKRVLGGCILSCTSACGQALLGFISWAVPYWRTLTYVIYPPSLLFIAYCWLVEESVRWLIAKGRYKKAKEILLKVAETNKTVLSVNTKAMLTTEDTEEETAKQTVSKDKTVENVSSKELPIYQQVLRSKIMMLRIVMCSFWWITTTMVYYGLNVNSVSLAGNPYVNFSLTSLVEIPGYILSVLTLNRFGRKSSIMVAFVTCGVSLISIMFIVTPVTVILLTMLGKLCISMIFNSIYVYTIELFPTKARHSLMGACSTIGRFGSMIAPQTPLLKREFYVYR